MKRHERINRGIFSTDTRPACEGCDTDIWFSALKDEREYALRICGTCPIRQACLDEALHVESRGQVHERHVHGIRGGMTARERLAIIEPVCPRCDAPRPAKRQYCESCTVEARAESQRLSAERKRVNRERAA